MARLQTVGAGMPVADLCDHVVEQGWSLPNIGVIKAQTVACHRVSWQVPCVCALLLQ